MSAATDESERTEESSNPAPARRWPWGLLSVAAIVVGLGVAATLYALRPAPSPRPPGPTGPLVEVAPVASFDAPISIEGHGTVRAVERMELVAEVAGEVVHVHDNLVSGGRFAKGDLLLEIDPTRYRAAVSRARAQLDATRARLELAKSEHERVHALFDRGIASREALDRAASRRDELAANLAGLGASAEIAREDLDSTQTVAAFDGRVAFESVTEHQVVPRGQRLGEIYGDDTLEIDVPIAATDAAILGDALADQESVPARIHVGVDEHDLVVGHLDRLGAEYRAQAQTILAIVHVDEGSTLLPERFVDVTLRPDASVLGDDLHVIPGAALRPGGDVWVVDDGRLLVRSVDVVHREGSRVVVRGPVDDGDRLVTSELDAVTDGMRVRVSEGAAPA